MSLCVCIGVLADTLSNDPEAADWIREELAGVNTVLEERGLPLHHEPEHLPALDDRSPVSGYPYSYLHYLRRFAALLAQRPGRVPEPCDDSTLHEADAVVDKHSAGMQSHLLCHSDCEGFYVPIDFK